MRLSKDLLERMSTNPQTSAGAPAPGSGEKSSTLGIRSIKEVSDRRDEELAVIFKEMRRASGVTKEQIAGRLATGVETVEALELGALSDLPDWPELKRIVTTYGAQLGLDARPILRRMQGQLDVSDKTDSKPAVSKPAPEPTTVQGAATPNPATAAPSGLPMPPSAKIAAATAPKASTARPAPPRAETPAAPSSATAKAQPAAAADAPLQTPAGQQHAPESATTERKPRAARRIPGFVKGVVNWVLLAGFVAALGFGVWYAAQNPRTVWTTLDGLPDPIPRLMRSAWELVRPLENSSTGPQISDPDKRKSDKLP